MKDIKIKGKFKNEKEFDSGIDLYIEKIEKIWTKNENAEVEFNVNTDCINILPNERALVNTGVIIEFPKPVNVGNNYYEIIEGQVRPKSGISNTGLTVCFGTVDNNYRGEIKVCVINNSNNNIMLEKDKKIAQLVFSKIIKFKNIISVDKIDTDTERGTDGFGSTGLK